MRIPAILLALTCTLAVAITVTWADPSLAPSISPAPSVSPVGRAQIWLDPASSPEYVQKLKEQAASRKTLYEELARARADLKAKSVGEEEALKAQHRAREAEFKKSDHTLAERKKFYTELRTEMRELRARQRVESKAGYEERKKNIDDFEKAQVLELNELLKRLMQARKKK